LAIDSQNLVTSLYARFGRRAVRQRLHNRHIAINQVDGRSDTLKAALHVFFNDGGLRRLYEDGVGISQGRDESCRGTIRHLLAIDTLRIDVLLFQ